MGASVAEGAPLRERRRCGARVCSVPVRRRAGRTGDQGTRQRGSYTLMDIPDDAYAFSLLDVIHFTSRATSSFVWVVSACSAVRLHWSTTNEVVIARKRSQVSFHFTHNGTLYPCVVFACFADR